eukprot:Rmarinus@m.20884
MATGGLTVNVSSGSLGKTLAPPQGGGNEDVTKYDDVEMEALKRRNNNSGSLKDSFFLNFEAEGDKHKKKGDYPKAIQAYTKALGLKPAHKKVLLSRCRCYLALGDSAKALLDAEATMVDTNDFHRGLFMKGEALYEAGNFEFALVCYYRAFAIRRDIELYRQRITKCKQALQLAFLSGKQKRIEEETPGETKRREELMKRFSSINLSTLRSDLRGDKVAPSPSLIYRAQKDLANRAREEEMKRTTFFSTVGLDAQLAVVSTGGGAGDSGGSDQEDGAAEPEHNEDSKHDLSLPTKQRAGQDGDEEKTKSQMLSRRPNRRVCKQLLGELYSDVEFLRRLHNTMGETSSRSAKGDNLRHIVEAGLDYMDNRTEFWRQQSPNIDAQATEDQKNKNRSCQRNGKKVESDTMAQTEPRVTFKSSEKAGGSSGTDAVANHVQFVESTPRRVAPLPRPPLPLSLSLSRPSRPHSARTFERSGVADTCGPVEKAREKYTRAPGRPHSARAAVLSGRSSPQPRAKTKRGARVFVRPASARVLRENNHESARAGPLLASSTRTTSRRPQTAPHRTVDSPQDCLPTHKLLVTIGKIFPMTGDESGSHRNRPNPPSVRLKDCDSPRGHVNVKPGSFREITPVGGVGKGGSRGDRLRRVYMQKSNAISHEGDPTARRPPAPLVREGESERRRVLGEVANEKCAPGVLLKEPQELNADMELLTTDPESLLPRHEKDARPASSSKICASWEGRGIDLGPEWFGTDVNGSIVDPVLGESALLGDEAIESHHLSERSSQENLSAAFEGKVKRKLLRAAVAMQQAVSKGRISSASRIASKILRSLRYRPSLLSNASTPTPSVGSNPTRHVPPHRTRVRSATTACTPATHASRSCGRKKKMALHEPDMGSGAANQSFSNDLGLGHEKLVRNGTGEGVSAEDGRERERGVCGAGLRRIGAARFREETESNDDAGASGECVQVHCSASIADGPGETTWKSDSTWDLDVTVLPPAARLGLVSCALYGLAICSASRGDYETAVRLFEETTLLCLHQGVSALRPVMGLIASHQCLSLSAAAVIHLNMLEPRLQNQPDALLLLHFAQARVCARAGDWHSVVSHAIRAIKTARQGIIQTESAVDGTNARANAKMNTGHVNTCDMYTTSEPCEAGTANSTIATADSTPATTDICVGRIADDLNPSGLDAATPRYNLPPQRATKPISLIDGIFVRNVSQTMGDNEAQRKGFEVEGAGTSRPEKHNHTAGRCFEAHARVLTLPLSPYDAELRRIHDFALRCTGDYRDDNDDDVEATWQLVHDPDRAEVEALQLASSALLRCNRPSDASYMLHRALAIARQRMRTCTEIRHQTNDGNCANERVQLGNRNMENVQDTSERDGFVSREIENDIERCQRDAKHWKAHAIHIASTLQDPALAHVRPRTIRPSNPGPLEGNLSDFSRTNSSLAIFGRSSIGSALERAGVPVDPLAHGAPDHVGSSGDEGSGSGGSGGSLISGDYRQDSLGGVGDVCGSGSKSCVVGVHGSAYRGSDGSTNVDSTRDFANSASSGGGKADQAVRSSHDDGRHATYYIDDDDCAIDNSIPSDSRCDGHDNGIDAAVRGTTNPREKGGRFGGHDISDSGSISSLSSLSSVGSPVDD